MASVLRGAKEEGNLDGLLLASGRRTVRPTGIVANIATATVMTSALFAGAVGPAFGRPAAEPHYENIALATKTPFVGDHALVRFETDTDNLTAAPTDGAVEEDGSIKLQVDKGHLEHSERKITGGESLFSGGINFSSEEKQVRQAKLTSMSLNIGNGKVHSKINGVDVVLGVIDTSTLLLQKKKDSRQLDVVILDRDVELSDEAAKKLDSSLGTTAFTEGDARLTMSAVCRVNLNKALAADLGLDLDAAIKAELDKEIQLNEPIDLAPGQKFRHLREAR
ncbi:hypothetical protein GCM10012275_08740 [Longimycelium tulufanense]|uniref:Uncharacterized protein n=2 Tax=Longimycelium tulufanense TaxID=907463 RepID=A0A8J3C6J5_9PSEU|nr:hypothetical protein GCM10012275_08740 [Longimycelium tulufanense]